MKFDHDLAARIRPLIEAAFADRSLLKVYDHEYAVLDALTALDAGTFGDFLDQVTTTSSH